MNASRRARIFPMARAFRVATSAPARSVSCIALPEDMLDDIVRKVAERPPIPRHPSSAFDQTHMSHR